MTEQAARYQRAVGYTPRRNCGLSAYERVLSRAGLDPVAGVDEAGRGACAGPLVVAAVVLKPSRIARLTELADSKALTVKARNAAYAQVVDTALDWSVVTIQAADIDRLGLHVCNVAGMRRALAALSVRPGYVLTDGFPVRGLPGSVVGHVEGRPGRRMHGSRLGDSQGHEGCAHGRAGQDFPGIRVLTT